MTESFFSTEFARSSKFRWDFLNKIEDINKWQHLSDKFQIYLQKCKDNSRPKQRRCRQGCRIC